jgi:polygalacturonase
VSSFTLKQALQNERSGWENVSKIIDRITPPTFPDKSVNVQDYGGLPDQTDARYGIQAAINITAENGGGTVLVPAGKYLLKGPIHLQDNINLHLEEDAILIFDTIPEYYTPLVKVRWEGTVCWNYSPFIYAFQKNNIALTGKGTIHGQSLSFWYKWRANQNPDKKVLRQMGNDMIPEDQRVFGHGFLDLDGNTLDDGHGDGKAHLLRPPLIEFYECNNIIISDLTLKESPFWTVHPVFCKNVTIRNLKIFGGFLNDDGIDPDSSEDVLIEGCYIETEDDAISIKAGRDQDAWDRPGSKNIVIRNCILNSGVNAFCIGSEMSGGVENIFVEDCKILHSTHGLNFKCNLDRGGQVQHVYLRQLEMDTCAEAMFIFRMDYHGYRGNHFPTRFNDVYANDITCKYTPKLGFKIVGVEAEPISRILLRDITLDQTGQSHELTFVEDILVENVQINDEEWTLEKSNEL